MDAGTCIGGAGMIIGGACGVGGRRLRRKGADGPSSGGNCDGTCGIC